MPITSAIAQSGARPADCTHVASSFGNRVSTMNREKMKAPTTMKKIAAVVYTVSSSASPRPRQPIAPVPKAITIATNAATAAASVGENQPR